MSIGRVSFPGCPVINVSLSGCHQLYCHYGFISNVVLVNVQASVLLMPPASRCVTIDVFLARNVFQDLAERGKTSVDWFFGFKLHLIVNDTGELLNLQITPGNTDDRKPVPDLVQSLFGKIFADRGYVSQALATKLLQDFGIQFFAKPRRNMKNRLMLLSDKLLARKRSIIETVIDQLKNISQIEHSRHRSPVNFGVNILCGLIAYCYQPKKPSLNLERDLAKYA